MRVSVVTFPVLRSRTVMVVILRSSCTVTDLSWEKDWSILPICLPPLSKVFIVSSYVEIRVAIHLSVRMSRGSTEQLATDETLAQSVTTDNEDLADLVGAVS